MKTAFISHHDCQLHQMGDDHPESPSRLRVIEEFLYEKGIHLFLQFYNAPRATSEQICLVRSPEYLARLQGCLPKTGLYFIDADTAMNPHTLEAAFRAVGANVLAVDLVMKGEVSNAFCAVRPPGHHAETDRAMGFCFFNNIAIAAAHALKHHGLKRVAILDFDVHLGNGTEQIFREDSRVLICSTFQDPLFPGSIYSRDIPHILNIPLRPGAGSAEFREAVSNKWLPAIGSFRPELIFVSAGFDAYFQDGLANIQLKVSDYSWVTAQISEMADSFCQGRIVSSLEGGYFLPALGECVGVHIEGLMGI